MAELPIGRLTDMPSSVADILKQALALSATERDELILELFNQAFGTRSDGELLTDELKSELDRRLARLDAEPHSGVTPEEAVRIVRQKLSRKDRA